VGVVQLTCLWRKSAGSPPSRMVLLLGGHCHSPSLTCSQFVPLRAVYLMPSWLRRSTSGASALVMNFGPVSISVPWPGKTP
jgi:hypothetical protein